ncbi:hypothetical protein [Massilia sp. NR 4-1]|uniref:hypothetical protein n=1 Tax=Massilia sp. NR 4-1 TaxID=1678028 RepID=UPI00067D46A5|nr:hypothetical protein [Massilia sp. NR 4-1]AKU20847.1 hypothetical protein ACZ75_04360 [Massilia sp. NR 4-1]
MQKKYVLAGAGLALILGISLINWHAATPVKQDIHTPQTHPAPATIPKVVPPPLSSQATEDAPLSVQLDRLVATHDPENSYEAYWLIANCDTFNRQHDRMIFDMEEVTQNRNLIPYRGMNDSEKRHDAKLCAGMTERMRLSRFDYLATAAKAGVSGAIIQVAEEGPFGDRTALTTRPDDPLVQEWKAKVLDQLAKEAESGDLLTLNYLWSHTVTGDALIAKDPALTYRYAVAQGLIYRDLKGPAANEATMYAPEGQLMMSIVDLKPEQRMAERAAAQRIADKAREASKH